MSVKPVQQLQVQIVRFVDDHQPGFVACEFTDADGQVQTLVDKIPIFATEFLDRTSDYPRPSTAPCVVLQYWRDAEGRELARVATDRPCGIETLDGKTEFVVLSSQLAAVGEAA